MKRRGVLKDTVAILAIPFVIITTAIVAGSTTYFYGGSVPWISFGTLITIGYFIASGIGAIYLIKNL